MNHCFYDLETIDYREERVVEFTERDDAQWSGVVELPPGRAFSTLIGHRTDVFVLSGGFVRDTGEVSAAGDFLSIYEQRELTSATGGAVLLIYREPMMAGGALMNLPAEERSWFPARVPGMQIANLMSAEYLLALFHWAPGVYVPPHVNPRGEELFVLSGELHVNGQALPRGSWLRVGAGELHDSAAPHSAIILLRSGHLAPLH